MIKILGWILLFYIIYTVAKNFFGPIFGSRQPRNYPNQGSAGHEQPRRRPGETTIHQRPDDASRRNQDDGEYIDYKEIK